jgi:hypothetical protein
VAECGGHRVDEVARPDDRDQVPRDHDVLVIRDEGRAVRVQVAQPREGDRACVLLAQRVQADRPGPVDADRLVHERLGCGLVGVAPQHPRGGEHHPDDAPDVGDGVADGGAAAAARLLGRGRQRRSVGERPGEGSRGRRRVQPEQSADTDGHDRDGCHRGDDAGHHPPARAQRPEERRPADDPDGVGEQHEPEDADGLGELERVLLCRTQRRHPDRREEDRGRSDRDADDPDPAQEGAEREEHHEQQDGFVGEEGQRPAHVSILSCRRAAGGGRAGRAP